MKSKIRKQISKTLKDIDWLKDTKKNYKKMSPSQRLRKLVE